MGIRFIKNMAGHVLFFFRYDIGVNLVFLLKLWYTDSNIFKGDV